MSITRREVEKSCANVTTLRGAAAENQRRISDSLGAAARATAALRMAPALAAMVSEDKARLRGLAAAAVVGAGFKSPTVPPVDVAPIKSGHQVVREGVDEVSRNVLGLITAVESLTDAVAALTNESSRSSRKIIRLTGALVLLGVVTAWLAFRAAS